MVKVSRSLHEQLRRLVESAKVDMTNVGAVVAYTKENGLTEVWRAAAGNPRRYLLCINEGTEASD